MNTPHKSVTDIDLGKTPPRSALPGKAYNVTYQGTQAIAFRRDCDDPKQTWVGASPHGTFSCSDTEIVNAIPVEVALTADLAAKNAELEEALEEHRTAASLGATIKVHGIGDDGNESVTYYNLDRDEAADHAARVLDRIIAEHGQGRVKGRTRLIDQLLGESRNL